MRLVPHSQISRRNGIMLLALLFGGLFGLSSQAPAAFDSRGTEILDYREAYLTAPYWKQTLLAVDSEDPKLIRLRADGSVDDDFGGDGQVEIRAQDIAVTGDRKILVLSAWNAPDNELALTRLLPSGEPDRSFGGTGTVRVDLEASYGFGGALAVDARGRILVGGFAWSEYVGPRGPTYGKLALVRLRPGGAVDFEFGSEGLTTLPGQRSEANVRDIALGPRGAIFALAGDYAFKLRADGVPDRRFAAGGFADLGAIHRSAGVEYLGNVDSLGITREGKIIVAGTESYAVDGQLRYRAAALRLLPDGSLDLAYGREGRARGEMGRWFFAGSMTLRPDGRLIIVGSSELDVGARSELGAIAFNPRGGLDRSFGLRGKLLIPFGDSSAGGSRIAVHPGGLATLVGYARQDDAIGGPRRLALARIELRSGRHR